MIKKCIIFLVMCLFITLSTFSQQSNNFTNIAAGKLIRASSEYAAAFPITNANDDEPNTIWGSGAVNASEWLYVDLGAVTEVNGLGFFWFDNYYATKYSIYMSNDTSNWTLLATLPKNAPGDDVFTDNISFKTRYIGILFTAKKSMAIALSEFAVYQSKVPPTPTMTPTPTPTATPNDREPAFTFLKKMGRGMNLMASKVNQNQHAAIDFQLMREHHFTHSRIGSYLWKPENVGPAPDYTIDPVKLQEYKNAIDWSLAQGLVTVADPIHYWTTYADTDLPKLKKLWEQLATAFADYPVDQVAFEIMNEPHAGINLRDIIHESLAVIRSVPGNENRIVIASGQGFSTRQALINAFNDDVFPVNDRYLIGTFHYYDPRPFTKQAAAGNIYWGEAGDTDTDWGAVETAFDEVVTANANWAARNGTTVIPIYNGEFGCDNGAPEADRKRWLWWVRTASEERGFANAVWNMYNDDAGAKGFGPWTTLQKNDPSTRYLHEDVVEVVMTRYEAESALLTGGLSTGATLTGASEKGYVSFTTAAPNDTMSLGSVYVGKSGSYDMTIRYSNGGTTAHTVKIEIYDGNNTIIDVKNTVAFPVTQSETRWSTITLTGNFPADTNIMVKATASGAAPGLNLDYLCITKGTYYDNIFPPAE